MRKGDFTFFFGAASGSARKVLQQLEEPHVMLSYQTENNQPWNTEELFVDSGGYSLMLDTGTHPPADEYLDYVAQADADYYALQDFPNEPEILEEYGRSILQHREFTREYSASVLAAHHDRGLDATPVSVLQGWETDDYLQAIDRYDDAGVLTEYVGLGSVCRRNAEADIKDVVRTVDNALSGKHRIHAFGVKSNILDDQEMVDRLASADSLAYDWSYTKDVPGPRWHQVAYNYLQFKRRLFDEDDSAEPGPNATLTEAVTATDGGEPDD